MDNETVLIESQLTVSVLDEFGNVVYEVVSEDGIDRDQALQNVLDWMRESNES